MKVLNRFMSALGYVPRSKIDVGSLAFDITVNSASVDAAIEKLGRMQAAAVAAEAAMNSAAALADFGTSDLCAESGRDLVLEEVRAQREQIAKVLKMLEAQQNQLDRGATLTVEALDLRRTMQSWVGEVNAADASGLPG